MQYMQSAHIGLFFTIFQDCNSASAAQGYLTAAELYVFYKKSLPQFWLFYSSYGFLLCHSLNNSVLANNKFNNKFAIFPSLTVA